MGALPVPQPDTFRFAVYIEDLRRFMDSYRIPYGTPDDVIAVAERMGRPGPFAGDLALVLRSILYREDRSTPRAQLLEIFALAVGGSGMERPPHECWEALSRIFTFITEVRRRPVTLASGEPGQLVPFPTAASARQKDSSHR